MGHENDPEIGALERQASELDSMLTEDAELGDLAVAHDRLRELEGDIERKKKELAQRIVARMEAMGLDKATAGGRRLGFREMTTYGVAEGRVQELKDFIESIAPEVNIPASTNVKKAVDAFLDRNPGASVPDFVSVTKTRSLTNAKA